MAVLVWAMTGIAIWHFCVFVPDRFWGGIVGAFLAATAGALLFGLLINGLQVPSRDDTDLLQVLVAVPGALAALAALYFEGVRRGITDPKKGGAEGAPATHPGSS